MVKINDQISCYIKEEFIEKLKNQLVLINDIGITDFNKNDNGIYIAETDYINLTKDELNNLKNTYGESNIHVYLPARFSDTASILNEANDRLWICNLPLIPSEKQIKQKTKIIDDYNVKEGNENEFYIGYWSGILAATKYLLGLGQKFDYRDIALNMIKELKEEKIIDKK